MKAKKSSQNEGKFKGIFKKNYFFEIIEVYKRHTNWVILHNDKKLSNQTDLIPILTRMISKLQA